MDASLMWLMAGVHIITFIKYFMSVIITWISVKILIHNGESDTTSSAKWRPFCHGLYVSIYRPRRVHNFRALLCLCKLDNVQFYPHSSGLNHWVWFNGVSCIVCRATRCLILKPTAYTMLCMSHSFASLCPFDCTYVSSSFLYLPISFYT